MNVVQHLYFDVLGVVSAQRYVVAFDEKLDRIAQGCYALDQNRLAAHQPHFHQAPAAATTPPDAQNLGTLSGRQIAQSRCATLSLAAMSMSVFFSATSVPHNTVVRSPVANDSHFRIYCTAIPGTPKVTIVT